MYPFLIFICFFFLVRNSEKSFYAELARKCRNTNAWPLRLPYQHATQWRGKALHHKQTAPVHINPECVGDVCSCNVTRVQSCSSSHLQDIDTDERKV